MISILKEEIIMTTKEWNEGIEFLETADEGKKLTTEYKEEFVKKEMADRKAKAEKLLAEA